MIISAAHDHECADDLPSLVFTSAHGEARQSVGHDGQRVRRSPNSIRAISLRAPAGFCKVLLGASRKQQIQFARFRRCSICRRVGIWLSRGVCVLFLQQLLENILRNPARGCLYVACAGSFGTFLVATEGGTRSRPVLRWFAGIFPLSSGRGEGAKMLSSVPGGHIWGHGGPAQHPRVNAPAELSAKHH